MELKPVKLKVGGWRDATGDPIGTWISPLERRELMNRPPLTLDLYELVNGVYVPKDQLLGQFDTMLEQGAGKILIRVPLTAEVRSSGKARIVNYVSRAIIRGVGYGDLEDLGSLDSKVWVPIGVLVEEKVGARSLLSERRLNELSERGYKHQEVFYNWDRKR